MIGRSDVDKALHRLLVELERPATLDEWRFVRRPEAATAHHGAVSVKDKFGNDLKEAA